MNEVRRLRIKCEIDQLAAVRERLHKIRDDEDRVLQGLSPNGDGNEEAADLLSEVGFILLVVLDKLQKAKR